MICAIAQDGVAREGAWCEGIAAQREQEVGCVGRGSAAAMGL